MVSIVLGIGKYWVSASSSYSNSQGGAAIIGSFSLNGVSISARAFSGPCGSGYIPGCGGVVPIFITENSTTLAWSCYIFSGGGSQQSPQHELWVMQVD